MTSKYEKEKLKIVGQNYQKARIANGITQEVAAEVPELSPSYLSDLERGKSLGSIHTLISLCNLYKITPNDILKPLINFDINLTNSLLVGFNSLNETNQEVISEMIRVLNEKQIKDKS
ncbi:MAG: helix-turn-helix transcriptional regulator [Clostridia bacterium]|jgi:transcriptional regulator with XRE-family HTH domain|nr:helix-turn-helix transcriptional regulator [Clostridia bacterium]